MQRRSSALPSGDMAPEVPCGHRLGASMDEPNITRVRATRSCRIHDTKVCGGALEESACRAWICQVLALASNPTSSPTPATNPTPVMRVCVRVCVCVCAHARACEHACVNMNVVLVCCGVCVCVCVCVYVWHACASAMRHERLHVSTKTRCSIIVVIPTTTHTHTHTHTRNRLQMASSIYMKTRLFTEISNPKTSSSPQRTKRK